MRTKALVVPMFLAALALAAAPVAFGEEPGPGDKKEEPAATPGEKGPGEKAPEGNPPGENPPGEKAPGGEGEKKGEGPAPGPGEKLEGPSVEDELGKAKEYYKHPDTWVEVVLKNGTVFDGVARKGVLAEAKEFVDVGGTGRKEQVFTIVEGEALRPKPGEKSVMVPVLGKKRVGIRIWYFKETKGFIFIDFSDIVEIRVTRVLTYADSKKLFQAIEDKEKKLLTAERQARQEEQKRDEMQKQADREDREKDLAKQKGMDAQKLEERKKWRAELLTKFPPSGGWNKDRKTQIMVKMVKGIDPAPEEKEFYNRYKEWEEAVKEEEFLKGGK